MKGVSTFGTHADCVARNSFVRMCHVAAAQLESSIMPVHNVVSQALARVSCDKVDRRGDQKNFPLERSKKKRGVSHAKKR